jgi:hypothetical protein
LRPSRLSRWLRIEPDRSRSYLQRMTAHYWVGYFLVPLTLLHAWIPMKSGEARGANLFGLWAAMIALGLLLLQIVLGLLLKNPTLNPRHQVRRWHYFAMIGVVVLLGIHLWLNS